MPNVRYVGPHDEVEVAGYVVARGDSIEVDGELAKALLAQADNYEKADKPTKVKDS